MSSARTTGRSLDIIGQMQVIVIGFDGVNNMATSLALQELGHTFLPAHDVNQFPTHNKKPNMDTVQDWLDYAQGKLTLHTVLAGFSSASGMPLCLDVKEAIKSYPRAKFILTFDDNKTEWYNDMLNTHIHLYKTFKQRFWWNYLGIGDKTRSLYSYMLDVFISRANLVNVEGRKTLAAVFQDQDYAIQCYERHNEEVKRAFLEHSKVHDNLLYYNPKIDGWKPLCDFLGVKNVPSTKIDTQNVKTYYQNMAYGITTVVWVVNITSLGAAVGVGYTVYKKFFAGDNSSQS